MEIRKRKKLYLTAIVAISLAAFIAGCKKDKYVEQIGVCPVVLSTSPADNESNVALSTTITITFNEGMNPSTFTQSSFTLIGNSKVIGTISYNAATFTMSFDPTANLNINTTYTGRVTTAVKDQKGNTLQKDYVWTFTTGAPVTPIVTVTDPKDNDVNVVLNKTVSATFNVAMNPLTFTAATATTFTLKQGVTSVAGKVTYSGKTAYFKPNSPLSTGTSYIAKITTAAKSTQNVALAKDTLWTFTTGLISAPAVISTDPADLDTNVPLNKVISSTFSEAMKPTSIDGTTFTLMIGTTPVAGNVSYSGVTATFTPTANSGKLLSGTTYTATITTGAQNLASVPMANDYVWNFSTAGPLGPLVVDLKSVARFGIIAGVGVSNNAGFSEIHDLDVGISPGVRSSIVGFPPAVVINGAIYASDDIAPPGVPAMLIQAKQDLTDAYLFAEGATAPAPATVSGDQGGKTLAPGIYKSTSTLLIQAGDLTLDGQNDVNAVWIFQIASDFTTVGGAGGNIILINGAQAKNIFWQTGSSATIGDGTIFKGNILALTSITMNGYAVAEGRMLARNGSVVMTSTNKITKP